MNYQFAARPKKIVIQKEILSGKVTATSSILVDAFDSKIVFRNQ